MNNKVFPYLLLGLSLLLSCQREKQAYVFTYFDNSRQDAGLFLAFSHDGYTWEDATDRISVPAGMSYGTAIVVPERYVKALAGQYIETE